MTASDDDLPAASSTIDEAAARSIWWRVLLVIFAVIALGLLVLWIERKPITSRYINDQLAARGVQARYRIADLGLGRQRLTNVVVGNPAHPDLIADWVDLRTHIGLSGFTVDAVRAGHVRLHGRIVDGRLRLGEIDKLLPKPSGGPFTLPALTIDVADARMRLETAQGLVGLKLSGKGALNGGFAGQLAAVAPALDLGTCRATKASAVAAIHIAAGAPSIEGPIRASTLVCGASVIEGAGATVTAILSRALDRWSGSARLAVAAARSNGARLQGIGGTVTFDGTAQQTQGKVDATAARFAAAALSGSGLAIDGDYDLAQGSTSLKAHLRAAQASAKPSVTAAARSLATRTTGTPIAPLADRLAQALVAAGRRFALDADVALSLGKAGTAVSLSRADLSAASGARIALSDADIAYRSPQSMLSLAGTLSTGGGGLPGATIRFAQARAGAPITGTATIAPYAAGSARLALTSVTFSTAPGGITRIATTAALSGPLGNGRVDALTLPIDARWDGGRRLVVNPGCAPVSVERLTLSGFALRPTRVTVCPTGAALIAMNGNAIQGGGRIAAPRFAGTLGASPITASAAGLRFDLTGGFVADRLAVRIGAPDRLTKLDFATLGGSMKNGALAGRFAGGSGQIGAVPLLLSHAAGDWRFAGAKLTVTGTLAVDDAATPARFKALAGRNVALTLAGGTITATGTLATPAKGIEVAQVRIVHDLARGAGQADLTVPGITFGKDLQPDALTPLTYGVIADVAGTVTGEGHIRWTPAGVSSDGTFRTAGTDLAAAFGPVTGAAGTIHFTDLLSLQSAPGQVLTVKTINPGVPVSDGTIRYQTLPGAKIKVEQGRWPFAGGTLALEPTLLDFGEAQERRLTFRVSGMDAAQFLQQFDFKNLNATGTFDGVLPMIFDAQGGRIEKGELRVRQGGGTIAYVGEISQKDLGTWGNLAFQTLKSLKYRSLDIVMNGPLAGEMVTQVRFAGIGQGEGAKHNFIVSRLAELPFVFNVRITAPFRSLIDSAASFYDPKRLIERNLPTLIEQQNKAAGATAPAPANPIQPPESRSVP